jgi:hypothetical protein
MAELFFSLWGNWLLHVSSAFPKIVDWIFFPLFKEKQEEGEDNAQKRTN